MHFLDNYFIIFIFFVTALAIAILVVLLPNILTRKRYNKDKLSPYECGFEPFDDARNPFDIRFYLVGILFLIFDIEIAFLIPWAVNLGKLGKYGFWSMMFFLFVLTVGFIYEWKKGALDWH